MHGCLALILHAHLPFVRHPEHETFLEEGWLFEAITETYLPLLRLLERWADDGLDARLTLTLSPTLCSMLSDPVLQDRYVRRIETLIELAEKEVQRTHFEPLLGELARFYCENLKAARDWYTAHRGSLLGAFRQLQDQGRIEIITSAATHALLPLLAEHTPSLRAQLLVARDHYQACFGRAPRGIWLPECAYAEGLEDLLKEAGLGWFVVDSHGLLQARPRPRYGLFAPILTEAGVAAFGRDQESARQVWSRDEGYPGDPRYRDFYRDIGFDLEFDYLQPYLLAAGQRGFTGMKYHRVTARSGPKQIYERQPALEAAAAHAQHFYEARCAQMAKLDGILNRPPMVVCPYDAELFGHWWYEGLEFLDRFVRLSCAQRPCAFSLVTPEQYLRANPSLQLATPAASSWGEKGHYQVWLNETNQWIYPHLHQAQRRMSELADRFAAPDALQARALGQAARELLLAQASDWPFILRTGTSPDYARTRVKQHLIAFTDLYDQIVKDQIDCPSLEALETRDNIFPALNYRYWSQNTESIRALCPELAGAPLTLPSPHPMGRGWPQAG